MNSFYKHGIFLKLKDKDISYLDFTISILITWITPILIRPYNINIVPGYSRKNIMNDSIFISTLILQV